MYLRAYDVMHVSRAGVVVSYLKQHARSAFIDIFLQRIWFDPTIASVWYVELFAFFAHVFNTFD